MQSNAISAFQETHDVTTDELFKRAYAHYICKPLTTQQHAQISEEARRYQKGGRAPPAYVHLYLDRERRSQAPLDF